MLTTFMAVCTALFIFMVVCGLLALAMGPTEDSITAQAVDTAPVRTSKSVNYDQINSLQYFKEIHGFDEYGNE